MSVQNYINTEAFIVPPYSLSLSLNDYLNFLVESYIIYRNDAQIANLSLSENEFLDTSPNPFIENKYTVIAYNGTSYSKPVTKYIDPYGNLASNLSATRNLSITGQIDLEWTTDPDITITEWQIYKSESGGAFQLIDSIPASQLVYHDTGNDESKSHQYRVYSVAGPYIADTYAESDTVLAIFSDTKNLSSLIKKISKEILTSNYYIKDTYDILLSQAAYITTPYSLSLDLSDYLNFLVESYTVYRNDVQIGNLEASETKFIDNSPNPFIDNQYSVVAYDGTNYSEPIIFNKAPYGNLAANLTATRDIALATQINLEWTTDPEITITEWAIYRSESGGAFQFVASIPASQNAYSDTGNDKEKTYQYRVYSIAGPYTADAYAESNITSSIMFSTIDFSSVIRNLSEITIQSNAYIKYQYNFNIDSNSKIVYRSANNLSMNNNIIGLYDHYLTSSSYIFNSYINNIYIYSYILNSYINNIYINNNIIYRYKLNKIINNIIKRKEIRDLYINSYINKKYINNKDISSFILYRFNINLSSFSYIVYRYTNNKENNSIIVKRYNNSISYSSYFINTYKYNKIINSNIRNTYDLNLSSLSYILYSYINNKELNINIINSRNKIYISSLSYIFNKYKNSKVMNNIIVTHYKKLSLKYCDMYIQKTVNLTLFSSSVIADSGWHLE